MAAAKQALLGSVPPQPKATVSRKRPTCAATTTGRGALPPLKKSSGVPSQGDGQGESQRSNLDALALCLDVLPPAPPVTALITVQTGHDGGQLVEQAGGRPCQSSTFRFIPLIEIVPAGLGPVPRTDSTPPQAKRWSLR